jgi:hypothetical protein
MFEQTDAHDLCFVELLGGLQYLSSALPYENGVILPNFPAGLCIRTLLTS